MAKNWAICIGINNYNSMPNLKYAQRDAKLMQNYFLNEAGFENIYLFTDNSPSINYAGKTFNSQPTYGRLKRFLREIFDKEFLSAGDNFWFFYSGHGMRFKDRDYLMPADADPHPDGVEDTAISLYFVTERLRRCGADNVILLLDACRSQESSKGLGI
ncbi:caspase family protein, partial [Okeania sp. SIO2B9]